MDRFMTGRATPAALAAGAAATGLPDTASGAVQPQYRRVAALVTLVTLRTPRANPCPPARPRPPSHQQRRPVDEPFAIAVRARSRVCGRGRPGADAPPPFVLDRVTVRRAGRLLLDGLSAQIPGAACTALVGPSGAGKSTLLRLLNRLAEPTSGVIRFRDRPLPELDVLELRRRVGLVGQQPVLLTDRVVDDLRVGRPDLGEDQAAVLLERIGLPAEMLGRATAGLSGGEAQRVCLARALAVGPEVLLLDEPTSALDAESAQAVEHTIRDLVADGLAVVLVSHNAPQARRVADHVLVLRSGGLVASGPADRVDYLRKAT
ncbi:ATP-binding cassette domain-containing protein [Kitasatospora sp. NPDC056531]|uniref:ABC transporter ATP-binding protein n=1 Tax=Kitasatospora sp. NPDC056531 TaxID=3345856 RepID=UPI0036AA3D9E